MKIRLTLSLICLLSFASLFAQTTPIPDPAFEQALIDLNIDNNGLNGNILNSAAQPVLTLIVDTLGISDLTGIEAFVNLEWLWAKGNDLTSVDLSSNIKLENLNLSFNQLGVIDLGENDLLTHINLEGNAITTIDVSHLAMLGDLDIGGNLLTSLDVTNNGLLTSLEIWNIFSHTNSNQISSIDLSNNPLLFRFLAIDNLSTSLDLSNNPALFTLNCSDNMITELDLTNNMNLFTVSCSNNQLTELDVAHLDLGGLNCYNNEIGFIDLATSTELVLLNCSNNGMDSLILPPTPYILDLYVHDNNLTSLDVSHLGIIEEFICQNNQLQTLNMRNGTNTFLQSFNALNNPELSCITVDDVSYANATFINAVDPGVIFSEDCMVVSIEEYEATRDFTIFPNPVSDYLNLKDGFSATEIVIFNSLGEIVKRNHNFPLSVESLPQGIYFIQFEIADKVHVAQFVKTD